MKTKLILSIFMIGLLASCSTSAKLEKSWLSPSFAEEIKTPFTKVLVVAGMKDESSKRIAEDKIAASLRPGVAVCSYTYITSDDNDQAQLEEKLRKDGFDGIILMRLKDVEKSTTYVPGTAYGGWYGYRYASPGYVSNDENFIVETNFYSLRNNTLLWSGTTSTLNPTSLEGSMDGIIRTIKYELQRKGILKK